MSKKGNNMKTFRELIYESNKEDTVFVGEYYDKDEEYVVVVYVKADNIREATKKLEKYKVKNFKLSKNSIIKLSKYSDLEDYETDEFKGDFAEFEPEYNEPN
jgi:hypothetical protein